MTGTAVTVLCYRSPCIFMVRYGVTDQKPKNSSGKINCFLVQ